MKFKDIKPYIQCNNYRIDVSLRFLENQIQNYLEDGLELIPDFQRGHVWTEKQQEKYVEFVLRGGESGLDIYFNHTKWNSWTEENMGWFVCVDGLQRLTACRKFMNNELKVLGYFHDEFEDKLSSTVRLRFHVNNLPTRREVLEWYLQINSGGTVHTEEELNRVAKLLEQEKLKERF